MKSTDIGAEMESKNRNFHERYIEQNPQAPSSDRSFGLVFSAFFTILALSPQLSGHPPHLRLLAPALIFLLTALACPSILHPLNVLWFRFGLLLHKLTSPLVLSLLFYLMIVPAGFLLRKKDLLNLRWNAQASTYWISRKPGPAPESMSQPF